MIIVMDDLISEDEATHCYMKIQNLVPSGVLFGRYDFNIERFVDDGIIMDITKRIESIANHFHPNIELDWAQIVAWPHGTSHALHYDTFSGKTVFTSITYLNCSYRGGETFFDDGTIISPKTGRTVFFDGKKYFHGVKSVYYGNRFSLPIWYKERE